MKKHIFFILLSLISISTWAQPPAAGKSIKEEVAVTNWGGRTVTLLSTFWTPEIDAQLKEQLNAEQIADIKAHCQEKAWPNGFSVSKRSKHTETTTTLEEKLAQLKLFRITTFDNIRNGQNFGQMSVVLVSPAENKEWNPKLMWDKDLYFLFYSTDLQIKK